MTLENIKNHDLIPYLDYLTIYNTVPKLGQFIYVLLDETIVTDYYISPSDLNIKKEEWKRYFRDTYILNPRVKLYKPNSTEKQKYVMFAEWLAENMVNYIDKKVDFNILYDDFIKNN